MTDGQADKPALRRQRAYRSPVAWATLLIVFALGLTADLYSKAWTFENIAPYPVTWDRQQLIEDPYYNPVPMHHPRHIIPRLLDARLVINKGAVFGIGQDKRLFFIAFTVVAIFVGLMLFARWTGARHRLAHGAIGLILAGGVGNLYDRIQLGAVRDFLHMMPQWRLPFGLRYPRFLGGGDEIFPWVFNIADVMLLSGMVLLMIHINRVEAKRKKLESSEKSANQQSAAASESAKPVEASAE